MQNELGLSSILVADWDVVSINMKINNIPVSFKSYNNLPAKHLVEFISSVEHWKESNVPHNVASFCLFLRKRYPGYYFISESSYNRLQRRLDKTIERKINQL